MVAMRAVAPMAAAETPSSAARAARGTICNSGRSRLAVERAPASAGMPRICRSSSRAVDASSAWSSPTMVTEALAPLMPSAPKRMRAPGMASSAGRTAASNSCWRRARSPAGTSVTMMLALRGSPWEVVLPMPGPPPVLLDVPSEAKTETTSGRAFSTAVARCTAASVSARVAPGASSSAIAERPRSAAGTKSDGISGTSASDRAKKARALPRVIQRCRRHHPSRLR